MVYKLKIYQTNSHDSGPLRRKREVLIKYRQDLGSIYYITQVQQIRVSGSSTSRVKHRKGTKYKYDRRK